MQRIHIPLPSLTYVAGGSDVVPLRNIPKSLFGRIVHVEAIVFDVTMTPTYTTAPTVIGTNNVVQSLNFLDGNMSRHDGGFNEIRLREYLATGRKRLPDPDADLASGSARYFRRVLHLGPPNFVGGSDSGGTDFAMPAAALGNGEIRITYGGLTDISTDTTGLTANIKPYARVVLLDEVRIPPAYQFYTLNLGAADVNIAGTALYETLALCDAAAMTAITAGDFGTFTLDLGFGGVVPAVDAEALGASFHELYGAGHITGFQGEPAHANDDGAKDINASSPTAVTGAGAIVQPILFQGPRAKISKLLRAESVARLSWTGSQASGHLLIGRILEQPPSVVANIAGQCLTALGKANKGIKVKTASKKDYRGPLGHFLPFKVAV